MATAVTTTVTELPESRVSVDVEVPAEEIQRSLESQARKLGREMKVPGFRTGKIPPAVVIGQIEEMRDRFARLEVVDRSALPGDFVILDFVGTIDGEPFSGGEGRDQLVSIGDGRMIPGFEEGLVGAV